MSGTTRLTYFAYGSNMSLRRLKARVPSAERVGTALLPGHILTFDKVSVRDGSGKCAIFPSDCSRVLGVLFRLDLVHKPWLDRAEGLGVGYREDRIEVLDAAGDTVPAWTYFATLTDPSLKPFTWYRRHVLEGAREAGLPPEYLAQLEAWPAVDDPDPIRAARELSIYSTSPGAGM